MALPFLPAEQIPSAFYALNREVTTPKMENFMEYVEHTWIKHSTFTPDSWSVFMMAIRTNNGVYIDLCILILSFCKCCIIYRNIFNSIISNIYKILKKYIEMLQKPILFFF